MKKFLAVIAAFFVLCSSVFAVELDGSSSDEQTNEVVNEIEAISEEVYKESPVADVSGETDSSVPSDSEVSDGGNTFYVLAPPASSDGVNYGDLTDIPVGASIDNITFSSVSPIQPSDTTGLKSALLGVLGSYDPVVVEYQYRNPGSDRSYSSRLLRSPSGANIISVILNSSQQLTDNRAINIVSKIS